MRRLKFTSKRLFLLILVLLLTLTSSVSAQDDTTASVGDFTALTILTHDGVERTYRLHLPATIDDGDPLPLIIALHRFASSGLAMEAATGLSEAGDNYGFAVAYPNAIGHFFEDGRGEALLGPDEGEKDDLGFLLALMDELTTTYNIDPDQVYLTGADNGGLMALRMACEYPDRIAGFISTGASMWDYHLDQCEENEPAAVNALFIHGSDSVTYPVPGRIVPTGDDRGDYTVLSLQDTVNWWAQWNGCNPEEVQIVEEDLASIIVAPCFDETTTALYLVDEAGHNWMRNGDFNLNQAGVDATEIIANFITGQEWVILPEFDAEEIISRTWRTYVPTSYDPAVPMPLVVLLHGRPGTGVGMALITDMNRIAEENGFIAVYPDGMNDSMPPNQGGEWNYVRGVPIFVSFIERDDTQFLIDMVADISQGLNVDQSRLYLTGFSNGGFMTQRVACEASDAFAAFAPVGATLFPGLETLCIEQETGTLPIMLMHGTEDVSIPWEGSQRAGPGGQMVFYTSPVVTAVGTWALHNGCDANAPEITQLESNGETNTIVNIVDFQDCAEGGKTIFYMIEGGGHNWPGVPGVIGEGIAGQVNTDIHAGQVIWDFFSQYTRDVDTE